MEHDVSASTQEKMNIETVKKIAKIVEKVKTVESPLVRENTEDDEVLNFNDSAFKACSNLLPEKTSFWTKVKNVLFYKRRIADGTTDVSYFGYVLKKVVDFFFMEINFGKRNEG